MKLNLPPGDIKTFYPDAVEDFNSGDHASLVRSFGVEILVEGTAYDYEGSYTGDVLYLLEKEEYIGFFTFGFGSCSGCDALQGCSSWADLEELRQSLWRSVKWFNSPTEALEYLAQKEWNLEFVGEGESTKDFVEKACLYLGARSGDKKALANFLNSADREKRVLGAKILGQLSPEATARRPRR